MPEQSKYRWNNVAGRYISPDGRFVPFAEIRGHLDATLDAYEAKIIGLATSLQSRGISIAAWQVAMRDALKDIHLASSALARGGWAQMSQADYEKVSAKLRFQYERLEAFAKQIERGLPLDGRFRRRHELYAQSGRITYHESLREEMAMRGMTEERSILAASDHCSECVSEAARGWVPIGELVTIGERICKSNCRCSVSFQ